MPLHQLGNRGSQEEGWDLGSLHTWAALPSGPAPLGRGRHLNGTPKDEATPSRSGWLLIMMGIWHRSSPACMHCLSPDAQGPCRHQSRRIDCKYGEASWADMLET